MSSSSPGHSSPWRDYCGAAASIFLLSPPSVSHGAVWRVEVATRADRSLVARVWGFEYSSPCGEIVADDAFDESFGDFVSVVVVKTWSELKVGLGQVLRVDMLHTRCIRFKQASKRTRVCV